MLSLFIDKAATLDIFSANISSFAASSLCVFMHGSILLSIAATFFCTYELTKSLLGRSLPEGYTPLVHMMAASLGEVVREEKGVGRD